jgi:hypothetical protein
VSPGSDFTARKCSLNLDDNFKQSFVVDTQTVNRFTSALGDPASGLAKRPQSLLERREGIANSPIQVPPRTIIVIDSRWLGCQGSLSLQTLLQSVWINLYALRRFVRRRVGFGLSRH